jgi:hypothetical protein
VATSTTISGWDAQGNPITSNEPTATTPPTTPATGTGSPVGWDAQGVPIYGATQSPAPINASISATPMPTTPMGKLARWIDNVSEDIKNGTDLTGVGTVLKKLGAHGVYGGNSQAVGDFMASLPLGLMKAAKGAAEVVPQAIGGEKGNTWQGIKDLVGGGLQALTIPASFAGPEASGLSDEGLLNDAGEALGNAGNKVGDAVGNAASSVKSAVLGTEEKPSLIQKLWEGQDVAQPGAQSSVRNAVQASADNLGTATDQLSAAIQADPLTKNGGTILDSHLDQLGKMEKAAYSKLDAGAGIDLKAEKLRVANDEYALKQLGNTEPDINRKGNLIETINDSRDRIAEAESNLRAAGIDPNEADALHKQRMAGLDFKKVLVRTTQPDGSVNVDNLLKQSNALRFAKQGDRLNQFFGSKQAADAYIQQLQNAQKLGANAVKAQAIARWVAGGLGVGGGVELLSHYLQR